MKIPTTFGLQVVASLSALTLVGGMALRTSTATFGASHVNGSGPANHWDAAAMAIDDGVDGSTTSYFNVTGAVPSDTGSACVTITYTGGVGLTGATPIRVYASSVVDTDGSGGSDPAGVAQSLSDDIVVNITVDGAGTGQANGVCGDSTGGVIDSDGGAGVTLSAFASTFTAGYPVFDPAASDLARDVELSWELPSATADDAMGDGVDVEFTWRIEAGA